MDFDDPDDIQTDREANEASQTIDPADAGLHETASSLFCRPSQAMIESLCEQVSDVQDVSRLRQALRYSIHMVTLYDYRTIQRLLGLTDRCEETVPFNDEEDKRIAGGGA